MSITHSPYVQLNLDSTVIKEKIEKLKLLMKEIREDIQQEESFAQEILNDLRTSIDVELCMFVKMVKPNIGQKMDEVIEHANLKLKDVKNGTKNHASLSISTKQGGADLVDSVNGTHFEIKASMITQDRPKCNFSWNIPSGTTSLNRGPLIESIREKTKNGYAKFIIQNFKAVEIKSYQFLSEFLLQYFQKVKLKPNSKSVNFGCVQCKKCRSFHRLDKIAKYEKLFYTQQKNLTPTQWDELFAKVTSQCD